jgi:hypothetical protein
MDQPPESMLDLVADEDELGIILAIDTFGSLNLKGLSYIIDMPESSALRRVKELLKYDVITIDAKETAQSRGKFYCLTDRTKNLLQGDFNEQVPTFDKDEDKIKYIQRMATAMKSLASFNTILNNFTVKYLDEIAQSDRLLTIKDDFISSSLMEFCFKNKEEMEEFTEIYSQFHKDVQKFHTEDEEEKNKAWARGTLYMSLYPLSKLITQMTDKIK